MAQLQAEIDKLKQQILSMAGSVEQTVQTAYRSLETRDREAARMVIESDRKIDQMEVDIEEEGLKVLALHQPVAIDLRFIVSVLKINNDLERIADLAVNIAERTLFLSTRPVIEIPDVLGQMARRASEMLKASLDSLVRMDVEAAVAIIEQDREVDDMHRRAIEEIQDRIRQHVDETELLLHLIAVSRNIERIADLATNICEDVLYMVKGEIVRHRFDP